METPPMETRPTETRNFDSPPNAAPTVLVEGRPTATFQTIGGDFPAEPTVLIEGRPLVLKGAVSVLGASTNDGADGAVRQ